MRTCIATISIFGSLEEKLQAIAAAGFDAIELFAGDMAHDLAAAQEVRRRTDDLGLAIDLYQPLRDVEGVDNARFAANLDRAQRVFDLMAVLGAPKLLICSNAAAPIRDDARTAAQLAAIAEQAALRGLLVAFEALSWGGHVRTFDHAWRIVQQASHPALGLVLDSFHTLVRPEDWSAIRDLPGDRIFFVQLSDAPRIDVDYMTLRRNHSTLPGRGMLEIADFTAAVLATGYQGPLSLEVFNLVDRTPAIQMAKEAFAALIKLQP